MTTFSRRQLIGRDYNPLEDPEGARPSRSTPSAARGTPNPLPAGSPLGSLGDALRRVG